MNTSSSNAKLTLADIQEIEKALYKAKAIVADRPKKVHMTRDFFLRLRAIIEADGLVQAFPKNVDGEMNLIPHFAGIPIEIHAEPCEKDYWFDYMDDIKNAAAFGWVFRKGSFINADVKPIHFTES